MCTEPSLLFGPNSIWKAIASSGYSEPWCLAYQVWWWNFIALILVGLPIMVWAGRSFAFLFRTWHQVYEKKDLSVLFTILPNIAPFKLRRFAALASAVMLITFVSLVGIRISNSPDLLIGTLGIDNSQQVYHLSKDGNDYLMGALRQVAYAMLTVWLAALLIGVFTLPPLVSSTLATIKGLVCAIRRELSAEEGEPTSDDTKISDIPHTYWRASQSRTNFETPKINLHVEPPENDQEFDGMGEKMTPKELRAEIFWLSRDGLHLWLTKPPKDATNEADEETEFKLIWHWVKRCYMAQAKKIDEKTFELDSNANYCDLPIPKFVLELEKVTYNVRVDI